MSNIYLARNPVFHAHTKHIEVHYHFIREHVQARNVDLLHINTNLQKLKNNVEKATSRHVWCLRLDGDKEYFSDTFAAYLRQEGIQQEFTYRHTPQQNGLAEQKNWHILKVARAMMNVKKNLPKSYWAKAVNTTVYLMNQCTTFGLQDVTPHEKFYGKKSNLSHVGIFDSISFVHIPDEM